ncbi:alpha/beta hydrolase [Mangrovimicrobium sediminis]|uniref:Alpha/beta hydrolase n=1 Tax=Mangrovimicrobium sediminis TaxID=2562682 RepID=A0A4Z0M9E4_9GAMM|nr:alpha/beta hydrolase [Haliea sp. SAOS-164]TGD76139.1 alpha/beta hydrolase [Haliea sp. SAOS-164]
MSTSTPAGSDPQALVADFERRAQRAETPCGDGAMVWRRWGQGPPLLLAHGAQGSWTHWIRNIEALAAHYSVWAVDLPGYGDSALPAEPTHRAISAALDAGLRQLLGAPRPLKVVGFSFGGVACAHLAAYYPEWVGQLLLVGTGGLDTPRGEVELRGMRGLDDDARREVNRHNLLQLMLHHPPSVDELALYLQAKNGAASRLNPIDLVLPDKLLRILPSIAAPVDAIWGEHDRPHPDPAAQEAVLRAQFPALRFRVIADAGHWAMYERPAAFDAVLAGLLDEK